MNSRRKSDNVHRNFPVQHLSYHAMGDSHAVHFILPLNSLFAMIRLGFVRVCVCFESLPSQVVAKLDELLALCAEPFATAICELAKKGKIKKTKAAVDAVMRSRRA